MAWLLLNRGAMVVSALVVTLSPDPAHRAAALARLAADPRLTLGTPQRDRVPVVTEASSADTGAALVEELTQHDGVARVDVVSIDFEVQ